MVFVAVGGFKRSRPITS